MARFHYAVLSRAVPGQEDEFIRWYREQHLPDVVKMPGVVSGKIIKLDFQRVYDLDAPQWTLLTLYELEGEHPEPIIEMLKAASGSDVMPMTDALTKVGMIQAAGHLIAASE
jgi:epsilon-lactone hydrolase